MKVQCFSCQEFFECGAHDARNTCWCVKKPSLSIKKSNLNSCFCEACFNKELRKIPSCFRLHVSYVGADFSGFQQQDNARTVAGVLQSALKTILNQDIVFHAAGRTDAGVHARGQVLSFSCTTRLSPKELTLALAANIPRDVSVWRIDRMPEGFDARRHSIGKRYVYRIEQGLVHDPFSSTTALHIREILDVDAMANAAQFFVGEHDFSSFRSSLCTAAHARRYVWRVGVTKNNRLIEIDVRGNAFCMNMVRIMVGTLIEIGRRKRPVASIKELLAKKDRTLAGVTAKPHGLTLEEVYYPDNLHDSLIPADAIFPRFPVDKSSWTFAKDQIEYGPETLPPRF